MGPDQDENSEKIEANTGVWISECGGVAKFGFILLLYTQVSETGSV